ncbi:MAG: hypothetical protein FWC91_02960 [Defluviitaleaceae bacterium]|nr:hypothetical protein [Defluviitaleaceae bacterium]
MLFQKHYDVFVEYIQRSIMVDDYFYGRPVGTIHDFSPVDDFLESLDLDVLVIIAGIKYTGHQTGSTFVEFDNEHATHQHYVDELSQWENFDNSKEFYIRAINSCSWEYGDAFVFLQGLERLGISLENVPDSMEVQEDYYDDFIPEFNDELGYVQFRDLLRADVNLFDNSQTNDMALQALQPRVISFNGTVGLKFIDYINAWNDFWFNKPDVELHTTNEDIIDYLGGIYVKQFYNDTMDYDFILSKILSSLGVDNENVAKILQRLLKRLEMENSLGITSKEMEYSWGAISGKEFIFDFVLSEYLSVNVYYIPPARMNWIMGLIRQDSDLSNVLTLKFHALNKTFILAKYEPERNKNPNILNCSRVIHEMHCEKHTPIHPCEYSMLSQIYIDYHREHDISLDSRQKPR